MIEFKITEQLPSLNDYINKLKSPNGKVMGAVFKRKVDNLCMSYIQPYRMKIAAYCKEPVIIHFVWYEKSKRRDVDNVYSAKKYILDAMQKCGALDNDNPAHVRNVTDEIHYGDADFVIVKIVRISELICCEWEWFEEWSFNGEIKECESAGFRCSACKEEPSEYLFFDNPDYPPTFDFCPHCGADMRGKKNEQIY